MVIALLSIIGTLVAVLLGAYLTSRSEVDKQTVAYRVKLVEQLIAAIGRDEDRPDLDAQVASELPGVKTLWQRHWEARKTSRRRVPPLQEPGMEELLRRLREARSKPTRGTLVYAYRATTASLALLTAVMVFRVLGLAYPDDWWSWPGRFSFSGIHPFAYERDLAKILTGVKAKPDFTKIMGTAG